MSGGGDKPRRRAVRRDTAPTGRVPAEMGCGKVFSLLNNVEFDFRGTLPNHSQCRGCRGRDVDNSSGHERTAVIYPNDYGAPSGDIRDAQFCPEWQVRVSSSQLVRIKLFATRRLCSFRVVAGKAI